MPRLVWGLLEPIDRRLFRHDYSDVAVLGKAFTRGPGWRPLGFAMHALNGAIFGLATTRSPAACDGPPPARLELALLEHLALSSGRALVDRYHPAQGGAGRREAVQPPGVRAGHGRHALFGKLLGTWAN